MIYIKDLGLHDPECICMCIIHELSYLYICEYSIYDTSIRLAAARSI